MQFVNTYPNSDTNTLTMQTPDEFDDDVEGDWDDEDDEDFDDEMEFETDKHEILVEEDLVDPEDDDHLPNDELN
jgi:hypothetical protein